MSMVTQPPILLRVTAHNTPDHTDPADANEFYAALGMLTVAWGRLEGHVVGNLLTIMNFSEVTPPKSLPFQWQDRLKFWTQGFSLVPALRPHQDRAVTFMKSIAEEAEDRNFVSHMVWGRFVQGSAEPTIDARNIRSRKSAPNGIDVRDFRITLSMLKDALAIANRLNSEMTEFTQLLNASAPHPPGAALL
jgi:hypothetical protein